MQKIKVKKGDNVIMLSGKDRGKKGKVLKVNYKQLKLIVEGVNIIKKHQRRTQTFQGGIIERPALVPVSKVMVVCSRCGKPSRMGLNKGLRVCKKCGEVIDKE